MAKSHVSMEQKVCVVCNVPYDSGALLLDKRLRESMDATTVTGWGACEEHQRLADEGYVALVETKPPQNRQTLKLEEAIRTGKIAHMRDKVFREMIAPTHPGDEGKFPMVFVEEGVVDVLAAHAGHAL